MERYKENQIKVYNSLSKKKENFKPITEGYVGMYVCGPTVYSNAHLGNVRTFMFFDIVYRYLLHPVNSHFFNGTLQRKSNKSIQFSV